jgi:hypothetical protein
MAKPPPHVEDLSAEDQQALMGNVTKIVLLGEPWVDDHIHCCAVGVHVDGRQIDTSLWWCGAEIVGAVRYCDESKRAMADLLEEIRREVGDAEAIRREVDADEQG